MTTELTITRPDDWHLHLRDGHALGAVVGHTARQFGRAIVMPNLKPPVTTVASALSYRQRILSALPAGIDFEPLMTLYLTNATSVAEVEAAAAEPSIHAFKLYPAGATTNSADGVSNVDALGETLAAMQRCHLPLLVHAETTDPAVDVFDREAVFIERHLRRIRDDFPDLPIVLEHVTTRQGVEFVNASGGTTAGTLTPQHLLLNRNALFQGGLRPHNYCLPVLKREEHRLALVAAATSTGGKFFVGTDSAPHARALKENACGCAGIYSAHVAVELYAEVFEDAGALPMLEAFLSFNGPDFYGLPRNAKKVRLLRREQQVPEHFSFGEEQLIGFRAGGTVRWTLEG